MSSAGDKVSKNAEKNEAKRLAKLAKLEAKMAKMNEAAAPKEKKDKKKVVAAETVPVVVTPEDMSLPMANAYDPAAVEASWYSYWEKQGFFTPSSDATKESYVIPIPPPNVTGSLHLGHALTNSIQDCMIRWNRMHGKNALFIPGCDHAGIATQVVVEKKLMRERKITRHDLGREAFINEIWQWKDQFGHRIYNQLKRLGSSNDWTRVKFTMDPDLSKGVVEAFVRLHEEKIIYRENRLVNWCTKLKTALSNLEVEMKELEGRTMLSVPDHDPKKKYEFGVIFHFAYPVENSNEQIVVATTRLETMLGDTAVAVSPSDERYKFVIHPFNNRRIPIIADDYVDPAFGTGAVKITPAHDFNDYAVGKRHNLEFINIFTDDGTVNENGAQFAGLQRFDARVQVQKALEEKGLYKETKNNKMTIPICGRSGNVVEPLMKPQWWVNCKDMAEEAKEVVRSGELEIVPQQSVKEWFRWLENIQDWCISRQLWWGHRVPAYFVRIEGVESEDMDEKFWVSGRTEEEARAKALARFKDVDPAKITLEQDPDVLDTWFSSALWPFTTLGWPEKTKDLELFYPNSLLETGWDILFFWVARMVMMGIKLTGKVPFKKVFCHAMVRDAHGRKMSKSLGNVIDPLDVIDGITLANLQKRLEEGNLDPSEVARAKEGQKKDFPQGIAQCGADALRFTLLAYTSAGRDINLDVMRIEGYRKFCNKLWNATKFALMKLGDNFKPRESASLTGHESLPEKYILSKLNKAIKEANASIAEMNFMQATSAIYNFWLYELCDVYIESSKTLIDNGSDQAKESAKQTLYTCLDQGLKMLHPMMPFVTEELYQRLPRRPYDTIPSICVAKYPVENASWSFAAEEAAFEIILNANTNIRSLLSDYNVKNGHVYVQTKDSLNLFEQHKDVIMGLLGKNVAQLDIIDKEAKAPEGSGLRVVSEDLNVYLVVKGFVNLDDEVEKLEKKLGKVQDNLAGLQKKTQVPDYNEKVSAEVREVNDGKMKAYEAEIEALRTAISNFLKLKD